MTWQECRATVERIMRGFTFTHPVDAGDTEYVWRALCAALPGCPCSVIQVHARFVHVNVIDEQGFPVYAQDHVVVDPPGTR